MGLQIFGNCNKRSREDCMVDEENFIPPKLSKTEDLWEEVYYPSGKCYQCTPADQMFYGTQCEQYNPPSWPIANSQNGSVSSNTSHTISVSTHQHVNNSNAGNENNSNNSANNHLSSQMIGFQSQQTIRCDENGKSYLDLGSGTTVHNTRYCNSRTKWCMCGPACYRQRRLTVLNISMCKLGRYRQFTDPSLHRSVLICNTLRYIEREMEQEGCFINNQQPPPPSLIMLEPPPEPPRVPTPYPQSLPQEDTDSGLGDDNKSINWGSVLSLSSQSDLDPMNNNDSLGEIDFSQDFDDIMPSCKLTPLNVDDILKNVSPNSQPVRSDSPDLDNIMHVLKFS